MKLSVSYLDGVFHEFFASVGKTVAVAVLAYAGFALDNAHVGLDNKNAALYVALLVLGRAVVSSAKVYVDNYKASVVTTTVSADQEAGQGIL